MEYHYPKFTPEMKKTHTILIPNMAVTQFRLMEYALRCEGYKCELLGNCGSAVAQLGLKYVHNDTCYPALLVIGQFLDALNSGKYDLEHTALLITQTGDVYKRQAPPGRWYKRHSLSDMPYSPNPFRNTLNVFCQCRFCCIYYAVLFYY